MIGGDVAAGPLPRETVDQLMALSSRARFVRGNADGESVDTYDQGRLNPLAESGPAERAAAFAAACISRDQRDLLADFRTTVVLDLDDLGPTMFCHGSPRSDTEIITTATRDERSRKILSAVTEPVVVGGHTHRQFDRRLDVGASSTPAASARPMRAASAPSGRCWVLMFRCAGPSIR